MKKPSTRTVLKAATPALLAGLSIFLTRTPAGAQLIAPSPRLAEVVALDECDPTTFNGTLGESGGGFCHNVSLSVLGYATTLSDLFAKAAAGTPDPGWDFEPDSLVIRKGDVLSVVNQGGEPHTFTEVAQFGGGFIPGLNHDESPVPECAGGFKDVAVARTRVLQGSRLNITNLSRGTHLFQCCIHPWMRFQVNVVGPAGDSNFPQAEHR